MIYDPVQYFCERSWNRGTIDLFAVETQPDGAKHVGQPLVMTAVERGQIIAQPTMSMGMTGAQQLMDELWRCGIRPTEGTGSAGSLAATERHLKDMQAVAMGLLRKDGVDLKP